MTPIVQEYSTISMRDTAEQQHFYVPTEKPHQIMTYISKYWMNFMADSVSGQFVLQFAMHTIIDQCV